MDNPRKHCVCTPRTNTSRLPLREVTCHVTTAHASYSFEAKPLRDRTEDRRIGLNMNYLNYFYRN